MCLIEYSKSLKVLVLTGGECMIYEDITKASIKYASSLGLITRIVTNGFWATTYKNALTKIKELKDCGLNEINFSSGIDHQQWVPFRKVRNAAVAASRIGFLPIINFESHEPTKFDNQLLDILLKDKTLSSLLNENKIKIERGVWMKFDNSKNDENNSITCEETGNTHNIIHTGRCTNLFNTIVINPYGECFACCGLCNEQNLFLRLGNIEKQHIKDIYETAFDDALKLWLYVDGPKSILKKLASMGLINTNNSIFQYKPHICDLCRYIFQNVGILEAIRLNSMRIIPEILIKYKLQTTHESKLYQKD